MSKPVLLMTRRLPEAVEARAAQQCEAHFITILAGRVPANLVALPPALAPAREPAMAVAR